MALYQGLLTTDMRGKTGGVVFSKGKGGTVIRMKNGQVRPRTQYQAAVKLYLTDAAQTWAGLPEYERIVWQKFAATRFRSNSLGNRSSMTGFNFFCQSMANLNMIQASTGNIPSINVLGILPVGTPLIASFAASGSHLGAMYVINEDPAYQSQWALCGRVTGLLSPGITNVPRKNFRLVLIDPEPTIDTDIGFLPEWEAFFGQLLSGLQIFGEFYYVDQNTGVAGLSQPLSLIVG